MTADHAQTHLAEPRWDDEQTALDEHEDGENDG